MKYLSIASLALVLTLSGCSSSPSIEEQTKLIEYQKCLELYNDFYLLQLEKNPYASDTSMEQIAKAFKEEGNTLFSFTQEYCVRLRP